MQSWCQQHDFCFYDHGSLFKDQHLSGRDGIHLTRQSEVIFASKTELVREALIRIDMGEVK